MSPNVLLAPRQADESAHGAPRSATLGTLLDQIRRGDLDSLYAAFEVPTIFAVAPWTADSAAVIVDHDGDAEATGLDYVLEVALARDLLDGLATTSLNMPNPTIDESLKAVVGYATLGQDSSAGGSWVRRCLAV